MNCLVIVESAAKAKTISKYLSTLYPDRTWTVQACFGHVCDLPLKTLGVDTKTWEATYEVSKGEVVSKLKKEVKKNDIVYLASDPDLEGYAIAHHLQKFLAIPMKKCVRVTFHEITKQALKTAFDQPSGWDDAKVQAQETRRILDRIVGYQVSPLLWKNISGKGLSAGRVQSAALHLIHKRYTDFQSHDPQKSWVLHGTFSGLSAKAADLCIETPEEAQKHIRKIVDKYLCEWDAKYTTKKTYQNAPLPFITSTLQQEAFHSHKFPPKMTMSLAQNLYEEGKITYMRTDSHTISQDATEKIKAYILEQYGEDHVCDTPRTPAQTNTHAQEAHEAIRPTDVTSVFVVSDFKSEAHCKLYDLIRRRSVASQMAAAIYSDTSYKITCNEAEYVFTGKVSQLIWLGYLRVYSPSQKIDTTTFERPEHVTCMALNAQCTVTRPKLLYTEADMIKTMEKTGIGRPSTYVSIIEKLLNKNYIVKAAGPQKEVALTHYKWEGHTTDIQPEQDTIKIGGTDKDRMVPLELGQQILTYLQNVYPDLLDVKFTAAMETKLDDIEHNELTKTTVLNDFYKPFQEIIEKATAESSSRPQRRATAGAGHSASAKPKVKDFTSFLKWRGVEEISAEDKKVLDRLPQKIKDAEASVVLGPYGIYVKTKDGKNKRLDKSKWEKVVDATISASDY
jgi:DNA topoisomerase I